MLPDDPDAQARFFYLAILGAFLAVGLFAGYRHRLGAAVQHSMIWVLIFAGVTIAIGFKDHLATQLFPGMARSVGENAIELRRADDGHFYADTEVNGVAIRFLVDTGASSIVLSQEDAALVGIDMDRLSYIIPTNTANGRVNAAGVTLNRIELGQFTDDNVRAMVNGGQMSGSLLGMSYLGLFDSFEVSADRMILRR